MLKGYRTYMAAAALVILAGLHAQGYISDSLFATLQTILTGAGFAFLRAAVPTKK